MDNAIPLLSLLVTIIGWFYTAYHQRRILERQIVAEKDKERNKIYISQTLSEISMLRKWFNEGYALVPSGEKPLRDSEKEEIKRRYKKWIANEEVDDIAKSLDRKAKKENLREENDTLIDYVWGFSRSVQDQLVHFIDLEIAGYFKDPDAPYSIDWGLYAKDRLEIISRETLGLPIDLDEYPF